MKLLGPIALLLVVIGAINWGLMGLMNMNLVTAIFGAMSTITKAVYVLVGLSGLYVGLTMLPKQLSMK